MERALEQIHYRDRLKHFSKSDDERTALLAAIIEENEQLHDQLESSQREVENEKRSRRSWQDQARELERSLQESTITAESSRVVLVVLDGDGAIFLDDFYSRGKDGGADAAYQLRAYIKNDLRSRYPGLNTSSWHIIVYFALSLQSLAKKLLACNIITRLEHLTEFGHGWVSQPSCIWTDVGPGKERADHKVREALQMYMHSAQCKHVYFGPCSDTGYLTTLEEYKPNRELASKITLIETRPAAVAFDSLKFSKMTITAVFRTTNLPERPGQGNFQTQNGSHDLETSPTVHKPAVLPNAVTKQITIEKSQHDENINPLACNNWTTVAKNLGKGKPMDMAVKKALPKRFILVNARDERIDSDLERPDATSERRFNLRTKDKNMCNEYHLRGECHMPDGVCPRLHGERVTAGELLVLRHKARGLPCGDGGACRNFDCISGHHCRFKEACTFPSCWFGRHNSTDFRAVRKIYEDGSIQAV